MEHRFLMKWSNVEGNDFLQQMRTRIIIWGTDSLTDKQREGIKKCVSHGSTRFRRALYPSSTQLDPIMKALLLMSDKDFNVAATVLEEQEVQTLKDFKTKLCDYGYMTCKQLKFAGALLERINYKLSVSK